MMPAASMARKCEERPVNGDIHRVCFYLQDIFFGELASITCESCKQPVQEVQVCSMNL